MNSLVTIEDETWPIGILFSCPREKIDNLLAQKESEFFGVYLLLSYNMVYVGQSKNLRQRTKQHLIDKDWWESVVLITTKDDSLNSSDIDYIESYLIQKSREAGTCDSDNKQAGNKEKVDRYRKIFLESFIENSLFLLNFIGIKVFQKNKEHKKELEIKTISETTQKEIQTRHKREIVDFIKSKGIDMNCYFSYCHLLSEKHLYYLNPLTEGLKKDMILILHNQDNHEINLLRFPANTFSEEDLVLRKDKPIYIDVQIDSRTLKEKKSGKDFSKFLWKTIKY